MFRNPAVFSENPPADAPVRYEDTRIVIDGNPRTLLCASLFPFRVPRAQWRQRLEAVRAIGYHAIDVYIPWNYHETAPGTWDFSGQRDIEAFLQLAHDAGLFALVRPGPYICSEWDGGAIPAWVATDPSVDLRQNDPAFLAAVRRWYDRILPIVARQQYRGAASAEGGPVIMVQLDNELDFFACRDPQGYIGALARMAREAGIEVPLICCAGQGDMLRAGGTAEGVDPAVNLYPGDGDVDVDAQVRYYRRASDAQGVPLVVTETNRWHRTLRRMIGNGVRFVGPFLQVSGWDFDYGASVNNWGWVEAFMTHDYDFGGVIDPAGQERPDAADARRLSAMIGALGERLAAAELSADHRIGIGTASGAPLDERAMGVAVGSLDLAGGGRLLTLTNVSEHTADMRLGTGETALDMALPAGAGAMLVQDLPLEAVTLVVTTGELVGLDPTAHELTLSAPTMASDASVNAVLRFDPTAHVTASVIEGDTSAATGVGTVIVNGTQGCAKVSVDAVTWRVRLVRPEPPVGPSCAPEHDVVGVTVAHETPRWIARCAEPVHDALPLEDWGVYAGAGRYRAHADLTEAVGVVLRAASDTVTVRCGGILTPWQVNGGGDLWVPFTGVDRIADAADGTEGGLTVTARIWGHSNFDDSRLDALRLNAKRGIRGAMIVRRVERIDAGWIVRHDMRDVAAAGDLQARGLVVGDLPEPRCGFGSRSTTVWPHTLAYVRRLCGGVGLPAGGADAALHIDGGHTRCEVLVNGHEIGVITPHQPTLWLGRVHDGDELAVVVRREWGEDAGRPVLLLGDETHGWTLESQGLHELRSCGESARYAEESMPVRVPAGSGLWLRVPDTALAAAVHSANTVVRFDGDGVHLTAFTDRHCLGRVVLGGLPGTVFAGGRGELFLVPEGEGDLLLYVEATRAADGVLRRITLGGPIDRTH